MKPRFSVIMPLYNKAPYVRKALDSVCAQRCTDWECVVVDDGSTDDSAAIVQEYADRVTIIRQPNAGVSAARNKGVAVSTGEYICFLDADDWWAPEFLQSMNEAIMQYPQAGTYGVNYNVVRNGCAKQAILDLSTGIIDYFKAYYRPPYAMPLWTGSVTISRKVFDEIGGFNELLCMAEDFDLWVRLALKYPVCYVDKPMAYYNQDVQVKWRAIGKLVKPEHHFVFNSDYLLPEMAKNEDVRHVIDMVRIVCLKQYYLSRQYHNLAVEELRKIQLDEYRDKSFAAYLWNPIWKERLMFYASALIKSLRNL